jgi:glycosyltransferase involved in cell wall biosynthesis
VSDPIRIAVLAGSPVYYAASLYRRVAADPRIDLTAIFASSAGVRPTDLGYGTDVAWDADPLAGYRSIFLRRADRTELTSGSVFAFRDLDVVRTLREGDFDVLWLQGYHSCTHLLAATVQRLRRRPMLLREEQTLLARRPAWKRALKQMLFRTLLRPAVLLPVGTESERWLRSNGLRGRGFIAPYAVENDAFRAQAVTNPAERQRLRRSFEIPDDGGPVILFVGRLIATKQPELLLDAFRVVRRGRRCTLLFVGGGILEEMLRARVSQDAIPDVVFAGFRNQSEIAEAYACADVLALPSAGETWGLVVNEAMNFQLPVVVSDRVGCAADLVRQGQTGYVVDHRSTDALADRLALLVDDPALRAQLGARAGELVAGWNHDVAAESVVSAIAAAVGPKRWARSTGRVPLSAGAAA